jgi:hypothetical protein
MGYPRPCRRWMQKSESLRSYTDNMGRIKNKHTYFWHVAQERPHKILLGRLSHIHHVCMAVTSTKPTTRDLSIPFLVPRHYPVLAMVTFVRF